LQKTTEKVLPLPPEGEDKALKVRPTANLSDWLTNSVWDVGEFILAISFVPFLVYFMLSWKDRTRAATVKLFRPETREAVYATLSGIGSMFRAFAVGNALCGFFMSLVSVAAFGLLGLPYFYFLGFISGFLSLIPYLGVVLAVVPPIAVGLSEVSGARLLALFVIIVGLHLFTINVLFPKVIGKRLHLNPLIVTIGLFVWSSIWGAMGLMLAVPITGAIKIIFDHVDGLRSFGAWMEE
jgi:predicted PurR-regulated permease PerM